MKTDGLFTVADRHCTAEDCGIVLRPKEVVIDAAEKRSMRANDDYRRQNNIQQPRGLPTFTKDGFAKVRLNT